MGRRTPPAPRLARERRQTLRGVLLIVKHLVRTGLTVGGSHSRRRLTRCPADASLVDNLRDARRTRPRGSPGGRACTPCGPRSPRVWGATLDAHGGRGKSAWQRRRLRAAGFEQARRQSGDGSSAKRGLNGQAEIKFRVKVALYKPSKIIAAGAGRSRRDRTSATRGTMIGRAARACQVARVVAAPHTGVVSGFPAVVGTGVVRSRAWGVASRCLCAAAQAPAGETTAPRKKFKNRFKRCVRAPFCRARAVLGAATVVAAYEAAR